MKVSGYSGIVGRPTVALASAAVLAAFTALCGCTVQPPNGTDGTDGKQNSPIHIELPHSPTSSRKTSPPHIGTPGRKPVRTPTPPPSAVEISPPHIVFTRGDTGTGVRELQARLRQAAWLFDGPTGTYDDLTAEAVKGFQGKRGLPRTGETDAVTWQRLLRMTHKPGRWELYLMGGQPAAAPDPRCMTGRVLCVSKTSRTLRWMIDGRTVSTMSVRFGAEYTPTREGVFHVYWKSRHHVSTLYHSPMPYAMFFSGGQAVHYSYDFAARGYAGGSHGCVNVRDEAAIADLFAQVRNGDKVVVYW